MGVINVLKNKGSKPPPPPVDTAADYAEGFRKTCEDRHVDPLQVLELARLLELNL